MLTRREFLRSTGAGAALAATLRPASAEILSPILSRPIPATGELLPVIGLGGSASFRKAASGTDYSNLGAVFDTLLQGGGKVFDTAAIYGRSEEAAGRIAGQRGVRGDVFWATKVYIKPASVTDEMRIPAARAQIERSFSRIGVDRLDLVQLHDITSLDRQRGILDVLKSLKESNRTRYIGATSIRKEHYADLERIMREEPIDFIGVDYAIDNRQAAERILPLAAERGIAVLAYRPFGISRLWSRVVGWPVPEWAAEFGAYTWAHFFIKYVLAHPAVTVVTPGTSKARHMGENLAAGIGRLPDAAMLRKMEQHIDSIPIQSL